MVTKAGNEAAQELQELQQAESDRHGLVVGQFEFAAFLYGPRIADFCASFASSSAMISSWSHT